MIFIIKVIVAVSLTMLANYIAFTWVEEEDTIKDRLKAIKKGEFAPIVGAIAKFCYCNLVMLYTIALFYGYSGISAAFNVIFYGVFSIVLLIVVFDSCVL